MNKELCRVVQLLFGGEGLDRLFLVLVERGASTFRIRAKICATSSFLVGRVLKLAGGVGAAPLADEIRTANVRRRPLGGRHLSKTSELSDIWRLRGLKRP